MVLARKNNQYCVFIFMLGHAHQVMVFATQTKARLAEISAALDLGVVLGGVASVACSFVWFSLSAIPVRSMWLIAQHISEFVVNTFSQVPLSADVKIFRATNAANTFNKRILL